MAEIQPTMSIEKYAVYREARLIVRQEFNQKLTLSEEWLDDLKTYMVLSRNNRLSQLYQAATAL